jgi:hypothetical protein
MYERTRFGTTPHSQKVVQDSDAYEQGDISLGWQGKSAAFGPAHVVDGVEILRGHESGHAVAALRNLRQINASRASGEVS